MAGIEKRVQSGVTFRRAFERFTLERGIIFGLALLAALYAVGEISGGHFNPAVTVGLIVGGRFDQRKAASYIVAQLIGAILAAVVIFVAAIVLGLVNAVIRPILTILTLPITILTLGLFYLVINGLTFLLASKLVSGFQVDGFWWAVLGALVVSIISSFVGGFAGDD